MTNNSNAHGGANNGGGNNHNNSNKNHKKTQKNNSNNKSTLKGECEELGNNVFIINDAHQADKYISTVEAIAFYVQREYTGGQYVKDTIVQMKKIDTNTWKPAQPAAAAGTGDDASSASSSLSSMGEFEKLVLQTEVKEWIIKRSRYVDNLNKLYALLYGQCTKAMQNKLQNRQDWAEIEEKHDPVMLLSAIRELCMNYQDSKYPFVSMVNAFTGLLNISQENRESLTGCSKRFKNQVDLVEGLCGPLILSSFLRQDATYSVYFINKQADIDQIKGDNIKLENILSHRKDMEKKQKEAYDKFLGYLFIKGADTNRSAGLNKHLANMYAWKQGCYPSDVVDAVNTVANYRPLVSQPKGKGKDKGKDSAQKNADEIALAQQGSPKKKFIPMEERTCYKCQEKGHIARDCKSESGVSNAQVGETSLDRCVQGVNVYQAHAIVVKKPKQLQCYSCAVPHTAIAVCEAKEEEPKEQVEGVACLQHSLAQKEPEDEYSEQYLKGMMLLDSESTMDLFTENPEYVKNVKVVDCIMNLKSNGGSLTTDRMGDVPRYQKVWTSNKAIANILSLANVRKSNLFHIDYDQNSGSFKITHKKSGKVTLFQENKAGLHVAPLQHLTSEVQDNKDISLAQTLDQNKQMHTKRQQERAEVAKALHESLLFPTIKDYKQIIRTNQIKNCPVTITSVTL